jgi:hypothetical protein
VIDEGHATADSQTNRSQLIHKLNVERRWIVTGTPTTHLLGLKFGSAGQTAIEEALEEMDVNEDGTKGDDRAGEAENARLPRQWTNADAEDLRKLEKILGHSLQIPIFIGESNPFSELVRAPLMVSPSPSPGAIQILEQVMQMNMFRHRYFMLITFQQ